MRGHGGIWAVLGIEATSDVSAIRRAYAARLKQTQPEDDPAGFAALRSAYETAMEIAAPRRRQSDAVGPVRMSRKRDRGPSIALDPPLAADPVPDGPEPAAEAESSPPEHLAADPAPQQPIPLQPKPAPPPSQLDLDWKAVNAKRKAVIEALRSEDRDGAYRALRALLRSREMTSLEIYDANEAWVTRLVMNDTRGVELIAGHAASFFRWDDNDVTRKGRTDPGLSWRLRELRLLEEVSDPSSGEWAGTWRRLQAGPVWKRRLTAWLHPTAQTQIEQLLNRLGHHRSVRRRLDRDALAWWEARMRRPTLPAWVIWLSVVAAVGGALSAFGQAWWIQLARAVICPAVVLLPVMVWLYGLAWPTHLWRRRWSRTAPNWVRFGWIPGALGLILVAAALPIHPVGVSAVMLAAILLAVWAMITGRPGGEIAGISRHTPIQRIAIALGHTPLLGFWFFMQPFGGGLETQMIAAVIGAIFVHASASGTLGEAWLRLRRSRQAAIALAALACAVAANLIVWTPPDLWVWPFGAALVSIAFLTLKPSAEYLPRPWRTARNWGLVIVGVVVMAAFSAATGDDGRMPLGTALRGGVALLSSIVLFNVLGWWDPLRRGPRRNGR